MTKQEAELLKAEASYFQRSKLWCIMQETVKQQAIEKCALESTNWETTFSGKMMLYNLGILSSIVKTIHDSDL